VIVLAHRGLRSRGPENSLAGLQGVADVAAKGIPLGVEFDARKTADDVLVTVHDADVHFDFEGTRKHLVFCDDFYPSMQHYLGANCPPRLSHAVEVLAGDVPLIDIDLKERGFTQAVVDACAHVDPTKINYSSHIPDVVEEARRFAPSESRIGMSVSEFWMGDEDDLLELLQRTRADFLFTHYSLVTESLIRRLHDDGKQLGAYTVNDQALLHELIDLGVDYPCTDKPEMAIAELREC
jgi:glycerophosphoryl diester phosphodiesterase